MSTTTDRAIAEKYSTEKDDSPSMIFEIQVSYSLKLHSSELHG